MRRPILGHLALAGLIIPTYCSIHLLAANIRDWYGSEIFAEKVRKEKSTIAIIVQIFSHLLGLIQVCALCTVIGLSFQRHAFFSPFSLNWLRFVNSACSLRIDWTLPIHLFLALVLFIAFTLVPAALWSGALTPIVVTRNVTENIRIPHISSVNLTANPLFGGDTLGDGGCPWVTGTSVDLNKSRNISFHNCLNKLALLSSASTASAINPIPGDKERGGHVHAKLDSSSYSFLGRSYGIGGSLGMVFTREVEFCEAYTFTEPGLYSEVQCAFNATAAFQTQKQPEEFNGLMLYETSGSGTLPEGLNANYGRFGVSARQLAFQGTDVFAWASAHNNLSTSYFALAADVSACKDSNASSCGHGFAQLHGLQCRLNFEARNFSVYVNNLHRTISATPKEQLDWPPYANDLLWEIAGEHSYISYNDGAFAGSMLGHAIRSNIDILSASHGEKLVSSETMLKGVEDFIADLMDNTLMSSSQSSFFSGGEGIHSVPANVARRAVVYGEAKFIYATFCVHLLIVGVCMIEAVRTRFWYQLSTLDLLDTASIAVGASYGGTTIAAHVKKMETARPLLLGSIPSTGQFSGDLRVKLKEAHGVVPALVSADTTSGIILEDTVESRSPSRTRGRAGVKHKYLPLSSSEAI